MKIITRDIDYAIRALCFIARHQKKRVCAADLVEALCIPRPFLRKILQLLNRKGLLCSYKGKGGGFALTRAPKKIYLLDVIEAFQGPLKINDHIFKHAPCPHTKICKLKRRLDGIEYLVITELKKITIASLL